jgi:hypothetical protein
MILTIIVAYMLNFIPGIAAFGFFIGSFGLFVWWVMGFFNECKEGYVMSTIRKPPFGDEKQGKAEPALEESPVMEKMD